MPKTRIARTRLRAFTAQGGLCCYCHLPMWLEDPEGFRTKWNLTPNDTRDRQCTAEHLVTRQDGGKDSAKNIAAACLKCNQGRHRFKAPMEPERFGTFVRGQVQRGQWHRQRVLRAFGAHPAR